MAQPKLNTKGTIPGTDGNDVLEGGNGKEVLYGLAGNDILRGGNGEDDRLVVTATIGLMAVGAMTH